ncbi:MAG TPA: hypothetical protein PLM75_04770, partial [bacterium]|nr:hypothetical protein [bacterium]
MTNYDKYCINISIKISSLFISNEMIETETLLKKAWEAREYAAPSGEIKVGCALATESNEIILGWNVGGPWSMGIHAEVCAIVQLVKTKSKAVKIAIVANANFFTPCGSCRDWLLKFCDVSSPVIIQNHRGETY